jgi:hypothetical protein
MNAVDELFGGPDYDHPKLRAWAARLAAGETALLQVRRPWDGFTRSRPELVIEFLSQNGVFVDSAPWEPGLNDALLAEGIRARTLTDEAQRLSLALRALFEPLARRYGDDYFNAVLLEYMHDADMVTAEIAELKSEITTYPPHRSEHREECRDDIKAVLAKAAKEQVDHLGYSRPEAVGLVIAALADYLDERFSITSRRKLGWSPAPAGFWTHVANLAPQYPGARQHVPWTATASDIAAYLRSVGFNATAATVERELLEHSVTDSSFPWRVTLDTAARHLAFAPKAAG